MNFEYAIDKVLAHEGGLTSDVGGVTKYGISQKSYPHLNIRNLTLNDAKAIYKKDFWLPLQLDSVDNPETASHILDIAVNSGKSRAIRMVQDSLNDLGFNLIADSIMGPRTLNAINGASQEALNAVLKKRRIKFYNDLAARSPTYQKYLKGWLKRAESFGTVAAAGFGAVLLLAALIYFTLKGKSGI